MQNVYQHARKLNHMRKYVTPREVNLSTSFLPCFICSHIFSDRLSISQLCLQIMMKAICFLMVVTTFGCALGQRKETAWDPTRSSSPVRELPSCPAECHCSAIVQNLQSRMAICEKIPVSLHQNIKTLQVIGEHHYITAEQILAMEGGLRSLDLSDCGIIDIGAGAFNSMNDLVNLKLSNNYIGRIGNKIFSSHHLQVLYLDKNGLETIEDDAFAELPTLQRLYLQDNELRMMSFTLPSMLEVLDISDNHISSIATDLNRADLKTLDLCANPLNGFPPIMSSRTLQTLCLEGKAAVLPRNTATKFPQLSDVTLVASSHSVQTELDSTTQYELSNLKKLITLSIVNYYLQNLSFLMGMRNLVNLTLQNITLASYEDISEVLESLQTLSNLSIDNSIHLVKPILNNALLVSRLTTLRYLSMRYTGLVSLTQQNIPENTHIDISYNPLRCDCHLAWIQYKQTDTNGKFLLSKKQTLCETPIGVQGNTLLQSVNMTCSDQQTSGMLEQLSDNHGWTSTTMYLSKTSTQVPMTDTMTNSSTASSSTDNSLRDSTVYIALGTVLLILIIVGTALAVTLYVMKKRRKCQITPDGGETPMEQQPHAHQMKTVSSKDMLIKK